MLKLEGMNSFKTLPEICLKVRRSVFKSKFYAEPAVKSIRPAKRLSHIRSLDTNLSVVNGTVVDSP